MQITDTSKKSVCFVLFLDTASLQGVHNDSLEVSAEGYVGLWRMVVVEGLPYVDNRVNGKIPKMLSHRLLPNAQYVPPSQQGRPGHSSSFHLRALSARHEFSARQS